MKFINQSIMAKKAKYSKDHPFTLARANLLIQLPSLIRSLIKWIAICFIAWQVVGAISELAGKETKAEFIANLLANIVGISLLTKISILLSYFFGIGGIIYGWLQRRQRRMSIMNKQRHVIALEKKIDPNRTSSEITEFGDPKREDQE